MSEEVTASKRSQRGFVLLLIVLTLLAVSGVVVLFGLAQTAGQRKYIDPVVAQNAQLAAVKLDAVKQALF